MSHDDFGLGLHDINNAGVYAIDSDDIGALAAAMRDASLKVIRIDLEGVADKPALFQQDRLHPTAAAHPIIFANIWPQFAALIKKQ